MARVGSGYCTTNYVARGAAYNRERRERDRLGVRMSAPTVVAATAPSIEPGIREPLVDRNCVTCGRWTADTASNPAPLCSGCQCERNRRPAPFYASVDATGEDSTDPRRVADGTSIFNMGLPAVAVEYGRRNAYGQRTVKQSRPVANNEIPSARRLAETAKRANLTPQDTQKRAVGGRTR